MQRAQRTFGRFLKRAPNEADVEAMLTDFTDSEQMLEKVCDSMFSRAAAIRVVAQAGVNGRGGVKRLNNFPPQQPAHMSLTHDAHGARERGWTRCCK
jgi:hypothetical protein